MGLEEFLEEDRRIAKQAYKWVRANIAYDYEKAKSSFNYVRTPEEVLRDKKGICSEQTNLYVDLLSQQGIQAEYVKVHVDVKGKKVNHACSQVYLNNETILVDTCYSNGFDINRLEIEQGYSKQAAGHYERSQLIPWILSLSVACGFVYMTAPSLFNVQWPSFERKTSSAKAECNLDGICKQVISTKKGKVVFKMPHKAHDYMKEAVLIQEMKGYENERQPNSKDIKNSN